MKETFLDKVIDKLIDIGFGILFITAEGFRVVVIVGAIIGFWYGLYYIAKL